jgi:ion channel
MTRKEPNDLYLTVLQLTAIVMVTASASLSPACIAGILAASCSLLVTAWLLTGRRRELLLAGQPEALHFEPGRFTQPQDIGDGLRIRPPGDVLYYSFVTLRTVGYCDVTPASPLARSFSLIEAVVGIMYVATMIARFVSTQINADRGGATQDGAMR